MDTEKDVVAINELETIIQRLDKMRQLASEQLGKVQPVISAGEIDLIKDHLDLVKKYTSISPCYTYCYK